MKRWLALAAAAMIPVGAAAVGAFDEKTPDTETIMKALFKKGNTSKSSILKSQAEAAKPDWSAIQKTTKEYAELGAALPKAEPEKGDKDSWKKLADKFAADTKGLDDAAQGKDLAKLQASQKTVGASCKACHTAHRGK